MMTFKAKTSFFVTSICALLITASCSEEVAYRRPVPGRGYGPPAHAPAHGHHRKYVEGVELIYDAGLGLYVVVGYTDYYYYDGTFYRLHAGLWEMSLYPDRDWEPLYHKPLPPGLRAKSNGKVDVQTSSHDRNKSRGNGKFKKAS
ncbi:MAG: hypothetical protein JXM79_24015 [Sedimentisphaerales bacterium]|nr:hypothetical protein [Sedimentisphaerales bacterium]